VSGYSHLVANWEKDDKKWLKVSVRLTVVQWLFNGCSMGWQLLDVFSFYER